MPIGRKPRPGRRHRESARGNGRKQKGVNRGITVPGKGGTTTLGDDIGSKCRNIKKCNKGVQERRTNTMSKREDKPWGGKRGLCIQESCKGKSKSFRNMRR